MLSVKSIVSVVVLSVCGLTAASVGGCKSTPDPRKSSKGEVCQVTNDCADGLNCVPRSTGSGGLCVNGEFKVAPTAKECAVIACTQATDCCPSPPQGIDCPSLQQQCAQSQDAGFPSSACTEYNTYCKCDGSKYSCDNGKCSSICQTNNDCGGVGSGLTCNNNHCVQCTQDSDCHNNQVCGDTGLCQPPCQNDTDCAAFNRCSNGHCSSTGGCSTDRECIAATKNVTATCAKDGTCVVPCNSDLECGNPEEYKFYSCIKNQCIYVGCQTDKECQLYLGGTSGSSGGTSSHTQIVCRDKQSN